MERRNAGCRIQRYRPMLAAARVFADTTAQKGNSCPVCSENPAQRELIDYEQFCGIVPQPESATMGDDFEMTVQELKRRLDMVEV